MAEPGERAGRSLDERAVLARIIESARMGGYAHALAEGLAAGMIKVGEAERLIRHKWPDPGDRQECRLGMLSRLREIQPDHDYVRGR